MVGKIGRFFVTVFFLVVVVGISNISFGAKSNGLVMGLVKCGDTVKIYENNSDNRLRVTVTVSDFCSGLDSRFTASDGASVPKDVTVPDGSTTTSSFSLSGFIPEGAGGHSGKIELECLGDSGEGFCIYKIEDIRLDSN